MSIGGLAAEYGAAATEVGLLEADLESVVARFGEWQSSVMAERGVRLARRRVEGSLDDLVCELNPLTSVEARRYLFVPTASSWIAYFDNSAGGTDAAPVVTFLAQELGCRGVRAAAAPDGTTIFELYGPEPTDFLNHVRSISVSKEARWEFSADGEVLPFEEFDRYRARNVRGRFDAEVLDRYLRALGGIRIFDRDFFAAEGLACLVEKEGPRVRGLEEFELAACRDRRQTAATVAPGRAAQDRTAPG